MGSAFYQDMGAVLKIQIVLALGLCSGWFSDAFAASYGSATAIEFIQQTSSVAIVEILDVNPEAGNFSVRSQTQVDVLVHTVIWGELPGNEFTFFLPEGTKTWLVESIESSDFAGVPKPVPGDLALVLFRADTWLVTPFSYGEMGYWRIVEVNNSSVLVNDYGHCIEKVDLNGDFLFEVGPRVYPASEYLGPMIGGVRATFTAVSHVDLHGPEQDPEDEGSGTYGNPQFNDLSYANSNVQHCLLVDDIVDALGNLFGGHLPQGEFMSFTGLIDGWKFPMGLSETDDFLGENVCFDDLEIPLTCELHP